MRVDLFDFELPDELIAQRPVEPRDFARLLVVGESFQDKRFFDLPELLMPGDVVVLNDTRVIPGRLAGVRQAERGTAKVEVTLLKEVADDRGRHQWSALARPAKRLRQGDMLRFGDAISAEVLGREQGGEVRLAVSLARDDLMAALATHGQMPIPPYLGRPADARDKDDYQTVFAQRPGAVAAPTASLHVTDDLMARLEARDISLARVTLHVGAGTFRPVVATDTDSHEMEAEWGEVSAATASFINQRKTAGARIVALGTTSLRLLESATRDDGTIAPFAAGTDLFITPGYRFKAVDALITNFHLPKSTLFMLVCAFSGRERILDAYAHAMESGYRFYSYGDACLLTRDVTGEGSRT
jgi:S-adenosylmethionine:tRNA ribosyltransferase-isomerase